MNNFSLLKNSAYKRLSEEYLELELHRVLSDGKLLIKLRSNRELITLYFILFKFYVSFLTLVIFVFAPFFLLNHSDCWFHLFSASYLIDLCFPPLLFPASCLTADLRKGYLPWSWLTVVRKAFLAIFKIPCDCGMCVVCRFLGNGCWTSAFGVSIIVKPGMSPSLHIDSLKLFVRIPQG